MLKLLLVGFLLAHGLIHASFLAPAPAAATAGGPPWPFHLDRSWLLRRLPLRAAVAERIGRVLVGFVVVAFAVAALGLALSAPWWPTVVLIAATVSLVQLTVWFHWWLPLGLLIDATLIAAVVGGWDTITRFGS